jgi:hypothetical protein
MTRIHTPRQLLFCSFGIFCILLVLLSGALLRYRLEVSDSRPFSKAPGPLQGTLPTAQESVIPATQGYSHKPTVDRPPLIASGSNYGLSHTECRTRFAGLFDELDRSVALRKELGNVSLADIDLSWKPYGGVRVMIYNHKVTFIPRLLNSSTRHGS